MENIENHMKESVNDAIYPLMMYSQYVCGEVKERPDKFISEEEHLLNVISLLENVTSQLKNSHEIMTGKTQKKTTLIIENDNYEMDYDSLMQF